MRRLGALVLVVPVVIGSSLAQTARAAEAVRIEVRPASISTGLGHKFSFTSTITTRGPATAAGLIAHLNVLSLREGVYVDPEDWSSNRTRYLPPRPTGGSTTIAWRMQAVNAGHFGVYVAVLSRSGTGAPITGPLLRVDVAERRTIDSGGILPLALGLPALLAAAWIAVRTRRRRPAPA